MMRRVAVLVPVLIVLVALAPHFAGTAPVSAAAVPPDLQKALPPHAKVELYAAIHGAPRAYAAVYRASAVSYLAVVQAGRRVWQRRLSHAPPASQLSLVTPSSRGLFALISRPGSGAKAYAYRFGNDRVTPGISGSASPMVSADEGATVTATGFNLLNHDTLHQGSVPYRFVTPYRGCALSFCAGTTTYRPDYPTSNYPKPNGVIKNRHGDITLLRLEVASTEPEREVGLMYRTSLDPDSGMIFVWDKPVQDSFWMHNTYINLTVAFLSSDGHILETIDMAKLTDTLHTPHESYQYAIEVNQGFFAQHGMQVGDRVVLHLSA